MFYPIDLQMKILTTAVFSKFLMNKRFHARKWRALVLLVLGVTLVSSGSYVPKDGDDQKKKEFGAQYIIGVAAVLTEVSHLTVIVALTVVQAFTTYRQIFRSISTPKNT